jgi:TetR/AcrR family transcriptional repressor of nem operon
MGHSQAEKAKSHERILKAAAKRIREGGLERLGVVELMKRAGLTHGGFYGHFGSRDQLIAEAMELAFVDSMFASMKAAANPSRKNLVSFIKSYLSRTHRDTPGNGCAVSALSGEVRHAGPETRAIFARHLERNFDGIAKAIGGKAGREEAIATMSAMVGAMILSRAVDDKNLSDEILNAARNRLVDELDG